MDAPHAPRDRNEGEMKEEQRSFTAAAASASIPHSTSDASAPIVGNGFTHPHRLRPRRSPTQLSGDASSSSSGRVFAGDSLKDRVALLILDMQEHFRPFAAPLLPHLLPLIRLASSPEMADAALVIFTQHGHAPRGQGEATAAAAVDDGALGRFWGADNLIRTGSHDWQLLPEIAPLAKRILPKQRYEGHALSAWQASASRAVAMPRLQ